MFGIEITHLNPSFWIENEVSSYALIYTLPVLGLRGLTVHPRQSGAVQISGEETW